MLKAVHTSPYLLFPSPYSSSFTARSYSSGARECHTHLYTQSASPSTLIGPATVIWDASPTPLAPILPGSTLLVQRQVLIRLHPAICIAAWNALSLTLPRTPGIGIRQLNKEFLTFEITGRRATEVVKAVLKLTPKCEGPVKEVRFELLGGKRDCAD